ncbi:divisome protein SepX/GlpR [Mycolicibacterium vinylchloridicum]|uniref:divisome protein SepX/GlpR n=1 Tax=Mycolicibacterium vinylchloridicum TaxID=2736928 RepID=UPI0015C718D7|nr:gephyrin-like molybdotransferase receptor GlpR [Mycolicibacterium vinylchloridicum]
MPSIPQSLLWISLVVLWLFVLVPMLISKRDNVRRTSDVALATRVLNGGARARFRRSGPSAGHRHDPDWQPQDDDQFDEVDAEDGAGEAVPSRTRSVVVVAAVVEESEPDYLDVDVVDEDSGALPVGGTARVAAPQPTLFDEAPAEPEVSAVDEQDEAEREAEAVAEGEATDTFQAIADDEPQDGTADEYETVEDTSGLEAEEEPATTVTPRANRPRRAETTAAAVVARKYRFRKRMLMAMAAIMVITAVLSFTVSPDLWWACGGAGAVTVLYLAYLRRQTRIEEQVRRRRQQRMARSRLGVENTEDRQYDVVPSRLRRPGAAVLDIDDEDPIFEHLDEVAFARHFDLPRAAGQ